MNNLSLPSFKEHSKLYVLLITIPVLLGLNIFIVRNYTSISDENQQLSTEVAELETSLDTFNRNKTLVGSDMESFTTILGGLIPNQEDYFSIIFSLEKLSQETGFAIARYEILLSKSTPDKLSLTIEGDGDATAFNKFLEEYQFSGGRLITNEKMEFSNDASSRIKLSLNFYHKAINSAQEQIKPLSQADINLMKHIQQKVTVSFKEEDADQVVDYETKQNPF